MINKGVLLMSEKFNQLIELFIAEEEDKAKELFHEIVVDKSREIYENLIDEKDLNNVAKTDEVDESEFDEELGGDAADDMIDDISADEEGLAVEANGEDEEDLEDRVVDLEDALDELKAEFERIMVGDEEGEEELDLEIGDEEELELEPELGDEEGEEELDFEVGDEEELEDSINPNIVREYTEKVTVPSNTEEGDGSAGPVAGANKMGGSAQNIAKGGEAKGRTAPTAKVQTTSTPVTGKQVAATKAATKPSAEGNTVSPVRKATKA